MADTTGHVKITDEQLAKSAVRYRKELLPEFGISLE